MRVACSPKTLISAYETTECQPRKPQSAPSFTVVIYMFPLWTLFGKFMVSVKYVLLTFIDWSVALINCSSVCLSFVIQMFIVVPWHFHQDGLSYDLAFCVLLYPPVSDPVVFVSTLFHGCLCILHHSVPLPCPCSKLHIFIFHAIRGILILT